MTSYQRRQDRPGYGDHQVADFSCASGDLRPLTSCDFSHRYDPQPPQQQQPATYFGGPYLPREHHHHHHHHQHQQHLQQHAGYDVYFAADDWRRQPASGTALNHHSMRNTINPQSVV